MRADGRTYVKQNILSTVLKAALAAVNADRGKVPAVKWYEATRHHSATEVTLRYAHLHANRLRSAYARSCRDPALRATVLDHWRGGVAERLKAVVLKTTGPQGLAGSNPASSAIRRRLPHRGWTSRLDR